MGINRRRALGGLSAAALSPLVKGCTGQVPGPDAGPDGLTAVEAIDTVVVIMMENRSFDHFLGSYSLVEGRDDIDGLSAEMSNASADGTTFGPRPAVAGCVADPPHGWSRSHDQWAEGENSGFVREHERRHGIEVAGEVMSYWQRDRLSCFYGLADAYGSCQKWFASVMGPTWPNRYYSLLGTSMGNKSNDPIPEELPSIFERVYRSGRSYGVYYGNVPFAILCARHSIEEPEMHRLEQFYDDAAAGTLPNFSWIDPLYGRNDDHPPAHPVAGQVFVQSIYEALAQSPQWERTLLIVTYDEHGGFFDHVPPPTTVDERADEGFDQLGFRVPGLVISPWVAEGTVSDTVFDHTSIMATLMDLWELEPRTDRDAAANSLLSLLDDELLAAGTPRAPVSLPTIDADDDELYAPECQAELPFAAPTGWGATGQPELELLARIRFQGHPKLRVAETDQTYRRLLDIAERQGVLRRR